MQHVYEANGDHIDDKEGEDLKDVDTFGPPMDARNDKLEGELVDPINLVYLEEVMNMVGLDDMGTQVVTIPIEDVLKMVETTKEDRVDLKMETRHNPE